MSHLVYIIWITKSSMVRQPHTSLRGWKNWLRAVLGCLTGRAWQSRPAR